jgi:putative glutamine amidotransferase
MASPIARNRAPRPDPNRDPSVSRPLVAVTATHRLDDKGIRRVRLNVAYLHALERAGLTPLVVPPLEDAGAGDRVLDAVAGLVLSGGEDVDPARFGQEKHHTVTLTNPARDATEAALTLAARERALPTLAICRGVQLLNVALGGTLVQDIADQRPRAAPHDGASRDARAHEVIVEPDSRLAGALGSTRLRVNSLHHQALDRVADGIRVTGRAPDGVIEGIESPAGDAWWMLGVQWHPEELVDAAEPWDLRLFQAFARRVAGA